MKKYLFIVTLITILIPQTYAVPAYPFPIKFTQPDGSEVSIQLKGDERVHWAETSDGYTLLSNGKNGWEYAVTDNGGDLKVSGTLARDVNKRSANEIKLLTGVSKRIRFSPKQVGLLKSVWEAKNGSNKLVGTGGFLKPNPIKPTNSDGRQKVFSPRGTKKLLMILIQFPDLPFTYTKDDFYALMNTQNYNLDGAKGSVRDYFREQSYWALDNSKGFDVATDVVGIYTANNNMAYYGADAVDGSHDVNSNELMLEAVQAADPDVDFTQYDNDGDGSVDGVYIVYAGYGQATSGIANTIWPHAGGITGQTFDGKTVSKYSCSNELNYNSNLSIKDITTIGVICHEFGHVCGAPDYYDTDYGDSGGNFPGTGNWDVMCYGVYNGSPSGSQPAHMNPYEKIRNGWVTPTLLTSATSLTMPDITTNPVIYQYNTSTANEYFLLENHQKTGFNAACSGHGLLIYHADGNYILNHDNYNDINVGPHQGFYPVCANSSINITSSTTSVSDYGSISSQGCPFPGTAGKTEFSDTSTPYAKSWSALNTFKPITDISENTLAKTVSFTFMGGNSCTPPTSQATNITFSNIQNNQMTINWTRGNGDRVIVLARKNSEVSTTPLSGTTFNANSAYQQGDLIDANTYVIYDGTGTNVTFTDLLKNSTYYFSIFEYNVASHCYTTSPLTGSASTTGCTPCVPTATTKGSIGITNVSFNTINNTTSYSVAAYTNYAETMTNVTPGTIYTLSVSTYSYTNTVYTKAWIDWNNDCTFQPSEEYDLGSSTNDAIVTKQIQVPSNAYSGYVTMRVRTSYGSAPTACGNMNYSETEDYTLKVVGGCTPPTVQATNISATNIQSEQMTINWTRGNGNKVMVIAKQGSAVDSYLIGVTDLTANADFGSGTQIGTGNYVVYNGTNNNVTITGLLPGNTYYFAIYEYNSPTNCILQPALIGNYTASSGISYCIPTETSTNSLGITNVTFNTMNNSSTTSGLTYTNYNAFQTTVVKNQSYNLSVSINTNGNNIINTKAWIDWNKNGTFDVPSEEYNLGSNTNVSNVLTPNSPLSITVPTTAVDGAIRMRVITRFSSQPIACGNNNYSEAEDYTLRVVSPTTTWNGSIWSVDSPTSLYNVIIDGNYNDVGFICKNLTINAGKQMTVASGTLAVGGNFTLKSDETNGTATLVDNGTVTVAGTTNVEQYLSGVRNWYMSAPVTGATATAGNSYYKYVEAGNNGTIWTPVSSGSTFANMIGYVVQPTASSTFTFAGTLNTGSQSITGLTSTATAKGGFNLIGNPYPSFVNWQSATKTNLSSTIWYRTQNTASTPAYVFDTYNEIPNIGTNNNGSGAVTGMIPPMQAFWVKVNSGSTGTLSFDNTMRSHKDVSTNKFRLPAANASQQVLRLQVSNGTNSDEAIVLFNSNASNAYDAYDSPKMTNGNASIPEIYTFAGAEKLVINGLNSVTTNPLVALGFSTGTTNNFSIKGTQVGNFDPDMKIILKDQLLNKEQDITDGTAYTFTALAGTADERFSVVLRSSSLTTGTDYIFSQQSITVFKNANNKIVVTRSAFSKDGVITVCNELGQKLFSTTASGKSTVINKCFSSGVYLVTVNEDGRTITKKLIVN